MKIAVRYYSRTGNTKRIAEALAAAAGCKAETVEVPLSGSTDLLFLGGSVYWGKIPTAMKQYIETLRPGSIGRVAVFATAGIGRDAYKSYQTYLRDHDFKVFSDGFFCEEKQAGERKTLWAAGTYARDTIGKFQKNRVGRVRAEEY